jgi:O-acetyl-ADP-ribose deacetylase (regulator of RNase III)
VLPRMSVVVGSIVDLDVDAIVNAANSSLQGGGGVDGAIHRAAGPGLALEARKLAPCPPGEARITGGHHLRARYVIHTVGPVWEGGTSGERDVLASSYRASLRLADENRLSVVAFPAVSTGIYGYPRAEACRIAVREVSAWLGSHAYPAEVFFCMFSEDSAEIMRRALAGHERGDLAVDEPQP